MPARLKPTLTVVGPDLVFQIAVGYTASIPIDEVFTLPAMIRQIDTESGGPGALGAVAQRVSDISMVWSDVAGYFLSDEDGNQLVDEDGNILYGPIE